MASQVIFCRLHLMRRVLGLIYRHYRPVYYSPSSHSALAEAELVYKEDHVSHSVFVAFDMDLPAPESSVTLRNLIAGETKVQLLVWTTTPWTLTANMVWVFYDIYSLVLTITPRVSRYTRR
jgi:isoleucyl-tRNA synthetase